MQAQTGSRADPSQIVVSMPGVSRHDPGETNFESNTSGGFRRPEMSWLQKGMRIPIVGASKPNRRREALLTFPKPRTICLEPFLLGGASNVGAKTTGSFKRRRLQAPLCHGPFYGIFSQLPEEGTAAVGVEEPSSIVMTRVYRIVAGSMKSS